MSACTSGMLYASHMLRMPTLIAAILVLACSMRAPAEEMLERRAREAAGILAEKPSWPEDLFHPSFTAQVSDEKLAIIGRQFFQKCGGVKAVQQTSSKGPHAGTFDLITEKDLVVPMTLAVDDQPPFEVTTLLFGAPVPMMKDLADAVKALRALPGRVSFGAWKLGDGDPEPLATLEPDAPLAIGSAFKLYVLGALVREVGEGRRQAAEVVTLGPDTRSLPSGILQSWPMGSPITLDTAANLMISVSDNTATDLLMATLSRERVEAMLAPMGMKDPARTRPFLSTGEMFRLKFVQGGQAGDVYAKLDETARRAFLRERLPAGDLSLDSIDPLAFAEPRQVDSVEWFASPADLCRGMDWLRRNTEQGEAAGLRAALSINRGLAISEDPFPWVGFKGGSEPGVMNLTYLLRSAAGEWFAVVATWNDAKRTLDETRFASLVQRAIWVLGETVAAPPR
jgi:hypothetical protein